ncbi:MAG: DUF106 domain-containing protein [Thermoplasmata archaeon]
MAEQKPLFNFSQFFLIFMVMLTIMIFIDNEMRNGFGMLVGFVLYPVIGFGGRYPVLSLLLVGILLTLFTTLIRERYMDWVKMARFQKYMEAYNKAFRDAFKSNNTSKMKKLQEIQPKIMEMNYENMKGQLKMMAFTMFFILVTFAWVSFFVYEEVVDKHISVPWAYNVSLLDSTVLPHWILLYSLLAIPFSTVFGRIIKHYRFKRFLAKKGGA